MYILAHSLASGGLLYLSCAQHLHTHAHTSQLPEEDDWDLSDFDMDDDVNKDEL